MSNHRLQTWTSALALGLLFFAAPRAAESWPGVEAARAYRRDHGAEILASYAKLLSIPNVPTDSAGLRANAESIRDSLTLRGVRARLLEVEGAPPVVFGVRDAGAERTLGIYVHYDGQPVDPSRWTYPPFEPTLCTGPIEAGGAPIELPGPADQIDPEWRLYARSAGDDKAPLPAIYAALDALDRAKLPLTSNLIFFFEGEEEQGSEHLREYLERYRELVDDVDLWLISDGPLHQSRRAQLVFGVRGYVGLEIRVYGAERYLHSGHYGNWAPNPALDLAQLLGSMKDPQGRTVILGFNDSVVPLTAAERAALEALPEIDSGLMRELGLARTEGAPATLSDRILLPSLNIRGLASATVGPTARNVIPTHADASLDIRLVKGNDPGKMLDLVERHIAAQGFHIVREEPDHATRLAHPRIAKVERGRGYPAARTPLDQPQIAPVIAAAGAAEGQPVILLPTLGGSLPLYLFLEGRGKPLVIVPIANHDDNQHAPDENIRIGNLWYGIDLFAALFTMPAEPDRATP